MNHIQLTFPVADQQQKDTLIALLSGLEITGLEEKADTLIAYAESRNYNRDAVGEIAALLRISFEEQELQERNWNEEWEKNFEPVLLPGFCSIRAEFHPKPENVRYDIVITPKMSFGTGHHATTGLMMEFMGELEFRNRSVFDFGTGTGILAILAAMMGASSVLALDNDTWSIENALENCNRNQVNQVKVLPGAAENLPQDAYFDILLANINRHILLEYMSVMYGRLLPGGRLLLSGILTEDAAMIRNAADACGFRYEKQRDKQGWVCMQFLKEA